MIIKGAKVYTEEGTFAEKEVCTEGEVFTETSGDGEKVVDGSGCYLIPGLTDIHFHGCMGKDFCDGTEESIQVMADYEASQLLFCKYQRSVPSWKLWNCRYSTGSDRRVCTESGGRVYRSTEEIVFCCI